MAWMDYTNAEDMDWVEHTFGTVESWLTRTENLANNSSEPITVNIERMRGMLEPLILICYRRITFTEKQHKTLSEYLRRIEKLEQLSQSRGA